LLRAAQNIGSSADRSDRDLKKAFDDIKTLRAILDDAISNGRLHQDPIPVKRRPPTVTLTKFKGFKKDFARFKQAFKDAYEEVGLSDVSLAINLNEYLEGEPKQKLAHLIDNVDHTTYETMWTCLDTFYGNEKEKARDKFVKFESMPAIKTFTAGSISILITALESNWALLQEYSSGKFLDEDNIHFYTFLKKIPLGEKDRFLDYCHFGSSRANFPTFKKWLTERWHRLKDAPGESKPDRTLQYWQDDVQVPMHQLNLEDVDSKEETEMTDWTPVKMSADSEGNSYFTYEAPDSADYGFFEFRNGKFEKIKKATFTGARPKQFQKQFPPKQDKGGPKALGFGKPKKPQTCPHCKETGHYTNNCETFKALPVKERYKSVRENKLCLRCLSAGHIAKDCRVKFLCDVDNCGRIHHRLLHTAQQSKVMYQVHFFQGLGSDLDSEEENEADQLD
jgi:hypothetical protein